MSTKRSPTIPKAANIEGTLVNNLLKDNSNKLKIAHPGDIMETVAKVNNGKIM
ncbi:hypothetical protein LGK95_14830 [Clostridium algoriphilum]|uniref:hypothetical protein n=1 Tax=Clostridium algoriphilum TaxID=198347 RepID=UPI001CF25A04|nr:hypothetical protein [Clostridium algoriphilum]MCB2294772.1 hypothetical protein [Clostridium algoriphilum]